MVTGKKPYRKNTVKGTRKGSKWPAEVKTAAICDLLTNNNLSSVAKRHGVPESTLRTWLTEARKMQPDERKSVFDKVREQEIRALQHTAAASARASVQYIARRLAQNEENETLYSAIQEELDKSTGVKIGPEGVQVDETAEGMAEEQKNRLLAVADRHRPMGDYPAANYLRALTSIADKAGAMLGDDKPGANELNVHIELI